MAKFRCSVDGSQDSPDGVKTTRKGVRRDVFSYLTPKVQQQLIAIDRLEKQKVDGVKKNSRKKIKRVLLGGN